MDKYLDAKAMLTPCIAGATVTMLTAGQLDGSGPEFPDRVDGVGGQGRTPVATRGALYSELTDHFLGRQRAATAVGVTSDRGLSAEVRDAPYFTDWSW